MLLNKGENSWDGKNKLLIFIALRCKTLLLDSSKSFGERHIMRQLLRHETVLSLFSLMLIGQLLFAPILSDIQAAENGAPIVAYFPVRVGRYGKPFTIRVHAMSTDQISKVTLIVGDDDKPLRGQMPRLKLDEVPVQVHAIQTAKIYSGPSASKRVKGMVRLGELLFVSSEVNDFYRVMNNAGVSGFVKKGDVDVLKTGDAYAVTLPASVTSRSVLTYSIEAIDSKGVIFETSKISMRLLTDNEIDGFIASNTVQSTSKNGKPVYKKPLFWAGMAALAGGAYYLSSSKGGNDADQAAVQVLVEWE